MRTNTQIFDWFEWPHWEGIMHYVYLGAIAYAMYLWIKRKGERTLNNVLLFAIAFGVDTLVHAQINARNRR